MCVDYWCFGCFSPCTDFRTAKYIRERDKNPCTHWWILLRSTSGSFWTLAMEISKIYHQYDLDLGLRLLWGSGGSLVFCLFVCWFVFCSVAGHWMKIAGRVDLSPRLFWALKAMALEVASVWEGACSTTHSTQHHCLYQDQGSKKTGKWVRTFLLTHLSTFSAVVTVSVIRQKQRNYLIYTNTQTN